MQIPIRPIESNLDVRQTVGHPKCLRFSRNGVMVFTVFLENIGKVQARQARRASRGAWCACLIVRPEEAGGSDESPIAPGWVEGGSIMSSGCTYDAVSILGFGDAVAEPLPQAKEGEIVLRYGGWSLQELRDSAVGQKLMHVQNWYYMCPWSRERLPAGIYHLRVPVPKSNRKRFAGQIG